MTAKEVINELKDLGDEGVKRILLNHGAHEPCLGVKIGDMQPIRKKIKTDYKLALELYDSGIYDAMYLATLIADDSKMTRSDLNRWVEKASSSLIGSALPAVAAGGRYGWDLGLEWIENKDERRAGAGWATLAVLVSIKDDSFLDIPRLKSLLDRVEREIHDATEEVKYQMNQFVICLGCYVQALTSEAKAVGRRIGKLDIDMGKTSCKVPYAPDYIEKVEKRGSIGKKRKKAKC